jgi:hypothetical protein
MLRMLKPDPMPAADRDGQPYLETRPTGDGQPYLETRPTGDGQPYLKPHRPNR